jgi:hypothetical protein
MLTLIVAIHFKADQKNMILDVKIKIKNDNDIDAQALIQLLFCHHKPSARNLFNYK